MLLCCSAAGCGGASDSSPVMGATRLMVLLAGISKLVKLGKQCRAQRVGVDLFGWLHQEALTHYDSLVVQRPPSYRPVVQAIVDRARNYLGHDIHPLFVLDGHRLPGQGGTDEERAKCTACVAFLQFPAFQLYGSTAV
jgi:hypothetical protein